jgi:hypothetical protein
LPFTGVAVKVPLILEPARKPFFTVPEIVNLRAVEVAFRVMLPDDVELEELFAVEVNVPLALPEMHVRFLELILMLPLTAVAGGLPTALQPLIENVAVMVCLPFVVNSTPGEMFAVALEVVQVVSVTAGRTEALATPPEAAPPAATTMVPSAARPAIAAAKRRVNLIVSPLLMVRMRARLARPAR